jgi:hypothetical protein
MKEYELYVPLVSQNGKRLSEEKFKDLKKRLVARFGGITHFPQRSKGVWKVGQATFFDEIIILRVLANDTQATKSFWKDLKSELQIEWKEKHVLIIARDVSSI